MNRIIFFKPMIKYGSKVFVRLFQTKNTHSFQSRCITNLFILAPDRNAHDLLSQMHGFRRRFETCTCDYSCAINKALIKTGFVQWKKVNISFFFRLFDFFSKYLEFEFFERLKYIFQLQGRISRKIYCDETLVCGFSPEYFFFDNWRKDEFIISVKMQTYIMAGLCIISQYPFSNGVFVCRSWREKLIENLPDAQNGRT